MVSEQLISRDDFFSTLREVSSYVPYLNSLHGKPDIINASDVAATIKKDDILQLVAGAAFEKLGFEADLSGDETKIYWRDYEKTTAILKSVLNNTKELNIEEKDSISDLLLLISKSFGTRDYSPAEVQRISTAVAEIADVTATFDEHNLSKTFLALKYACEDEMFGYYLKALEKSIIVETYNVINIPESKDPSDYAATWEGIINVADEICAADSSGQSLFAKLIRKELRELTSNTHYYLVKLGMGDVPLILINGYKSTVIEVKNNLGLTESEDNIKFNLQFDAVQNLSKLVKNAEENHEIVSRSRGTTKEDETTVIPDEETEKHGHISLEETYFKVRLDRIEADDLLKFAAQSDLEVWRLFAQRQKDVLSSIGISLEFTKESVPDLSDAGILEQNLSDGLGFFPLRVSISDPESLKSFIDLVKKIPASQSTFAIFSNLSKMLAVGIMHGIEYDSPADTFGSLKELFDARPLYKMISAVSISGGFRPLRCFCDADHDDQLPVVYELARAKLFIHNPKVVLFDNQGPANWHVSRTADEVGALWQRAYSAIDSMISSGKFDEEQILYLKKRLSGTEPFEGYSITEYLEIPYKNDEIDDLVNAGYPTGQELIELKKRLSSWQANFVELLKIEDH